MAIFLIYTGSESGQHPGSGDHSLPDPDKSPPTPLPLSLHFRVSFGNEPGLGALSRLSDSDTLGAQEFSPWVKESQGSVIHKRESGEITYFPNIMGLVKELRKQP